MVQAMNLELFEFLLQVHYLTPSQTLPQSHTPALLQGLIHISYHPLNKVLFLVVFQVFIQVEYINMMYLDMIQSLIQALIQVTISQVHVQVLWIQVLFQTLFWAM